MRSAAWRGVSDFAKDLVVKLLTVDAARRATAQQALLHPWIQVRFDERFLPLYPPLWLQERDKCASKRHLTETVDELGRFNDRCRLKVTGVLPGSMRPIEER